MLTSKSHMEDMYNKLVESHITLGVMRDSVRQLGADIQNELINRLAAAQERGEMMDKTAIKDVFEEYEEKAEELGNDDLPEVGPEDLPDWELDEMDGPGEISPENSGAPGDQVATDGGEP